MSFTNRPPRILGIFSGWRLQAYGYALAAIYAGLLTRKPQFGILFPVALAAAINGARSPALPRPPLSWPALRSSGSEAAPDLHFLEGLVIQGSLQLFAGPGSNWGLLQTGYGLVRYLGGGAAVACVAQGMAMAGLGLTVWLVWRFELRYALEAATLSPAALAATLHAFAYDLAALALPIAFLASDQMRCGLLPGEQTILLALFGTVLCRPRDCRRRPVGTTFGCIPLGPFVTLTLLGVALRRAVCSSDLEQFSENFCETILAAGD